MPLPQATEGGAQQLGEACPPLNRNGFTILYGESDSKVE
jgi:hypothetical protein